MRSNEIIRQYQREQQQQQEQEGVAADADEDLDDDFAGGGAVNGDGPQPEGAPREMVLRCLECSFFCRSNNQMARHISLTMHCVRKCDHCTVRLVCFTFAQGVNKFLGRARKDRCLAEAFTVDTPEHHREFSGHDNFPFAFHKDRFIGQLKPGEELPPERASVPAANGTGTQDPQFICPDCQFTAATWSQMTKHLDTTHHASSVCAKCSVILRCYGCAQPLRHEKFAQHRSLTGPFYSKLDFAIGHPKEPVVPQWYCEMCDLTFIHKLHIAEHLIDCHNCRLPPGSFSYYIECKDCQTRFSSLGAAIDHRREKLHHDFELPPEASFIDAYQVKHLRRYPPLGSAAPGTTKHGAIFFQCPVCCRIFTSWARLEQHLFSTKHSLPFCRDCGTIHKLRALNEDHSSLQASHRAVCGAQTAKLNYEVLVDVDDAELMKQIDDKAPQPSEYDPHDAELFIYQCPISTCCKPFMRQLELERHMEDTGHGIVQCGTCSEKLDVLHDDVYFHEHEVPGLSEDMAEFRTKRANGCRVVLREAALLAYFPNDFKKCEECSSPVPDADVTTHRGSLACRAAKARRAAWMTLAQTAAALQQYRGQRAPPPPPPPPPPPAPHAAPPAPTHATYHPQQTSYGPPPGGHVQVHVQPAPPPQGVLAPPPPHGGYYHQPAPLPPPQQYAPLPQGQQQHYQPAMQPPPQGGAYYVVSGQPPGHAIAAYPQPQPQPQPQLQPQQPPQASHPVALQLVNSDGSIQQVYMVGPGPLPFQHPQQPQQQPPQQQQQQQPPPPQQQPQGPFMFGPPAQGGNTPPSSTSYYSSAPQYSQPPPQATAPPQAQHYASGPPPPQQGPPPATTYYSNGAYYTTNPAPQRGPPPSAPSAPQSVYYSTAPPPPQGYAQPPPQGYAQPPPQGYAPPPGAYTSPPYAPPPGGSYMPPSQPSPPAPPQQPGLASYSPAPRPTVTQQPLPPPLSAGFPQTQAATH